MIIPPNVVSHRANLFSAICQIASSEIGTLFEFPVKEQRFSNQLASFSASRQHINLGPHLTTYTRKRPRIIGRSVFFGANSLDLSSSPLTLDLFKTFLASKNHRVTKYDLAKRVYGIKDSKEISSRYWAATKLNITKLISRSRKQAMEHLTPNDQSISWFSYNSIPDAWELYSISDTTHPQWKD
jgi:hypothetical protein